MHILQLIDQEALVPPLPPPQEQLRYGYIAKTFMKIKKINFATTTIELIKREPSSLFKKNRDRKEN